MQSAIIVLAVISSLVLQVVGPAYNAAAAPAVALNPSSGNPPTVSGSLSGAGWLCGSGAAPTGAARVSGTGVGGSATIDRAGNLTGSFTARGDAGQRVEVKVTAGTSCPSIGPPINLQASAIFTFNAPSPTPTATAQPSPTPTTARQSSPTPTAASQPTSTPTRPAVAQPSATPTLEPALEPTSTATPEAEPSPTPTAEQPTPASTAPVEAAPSPTFTATAETAPTSTPTAREEDTSSPTPTVPSKLAATPLPASTVKPAASPVATPTATGGASSLGGVGGSLIFVGCTPSPWQVGVEFLPLGTFDAGGAGAGQPSGAAISVPAVQAPNQPQMFTFQTPPTAENGRWYQVQAKVDDSQCALDTESTSSYWLAGPGKDIRMPLVPIGNTWLQASNNGDKPPIPLPEVKGVFIELGKAPRYGNAKPADPDTGWGTQFTFFGGELKGRKQRFRWSTELNSAISGTLQVSWLPFPRAHENDPFSPPGMLASWPVECIECEFIIDLSPLPAPGASAKPGGSWLELFGQIVATPFKAAGNLLGDMANALIVLFGGGSKETPAKQIQVANLPPSSPANYEAANHINPWVTGTFYFRILPMKGGKVVGDGSNAVVFRWGGEQAPMANPKLISPPSPTPTPTPAYEVQIVSYHGILNPIGDCDGWGGSVVTQDVWAAANGGWAAVPYTTEPQPWPPVFKKGDVICPPKGNKSKSILKYIEEGLSGAWDWLGEAYKSLKNEVISAVGMLLPDDLCDNSCVGFLLDATLVSLGIPPDIPNFGDLMDEGLDYVAQQAVAQIGIPQEVYNQVGPYAGMALAEAEAKFKEEAQAKLKEGLKKGALQAELAYSSSSNGVPYGIPARADDYQPAAISVKVTRKPGVPGGENGCTLGISDYLTFDQAKLDNPPSPGWEKVTKQLDSKTKYDFFADSTPGEAYKRVVPVPPLALGQSVVIPMTFGLFTDYYGKYSYEKSPPWTDMQELGIIHLFVGGCGETQLELPAGAGGGKGDGIQYVAPGYKPAGG